MSLVAYDDARLASYQRWSLFIDGIQLRLSGSVAAVRPAIERAIAALGVTFAGAKNEK